MSINLFIHVQPQTLKSPLNVLSLTPLECSSPFPTRASGLPMQCAMSVLVPTCANAVCQPVPVQCARLAAKVVAASLFCLSCASLSSSTPPQSIDVLAACEGVGWISSLSAF